jgi:hypothetical protein
MELVPNTDLCLTSRDLFVHDVRRVAGALDGEEHCKGDHYLLCQCYHCGIAMVSLKEMGGHNARQKTKHNTLQLSG